MSDTIDDFKARLNLIEYRAAVSGSGVAMDTFTQTRDLFQAFAAAAREERDALRAEKERLRAAMSVAIDALDEIAFAGMSGSGQESEEGMRDWHARRAWEFIGIAARAKTDVLATMQADAAIAERARDTDHSA